MTLLVEKGTFVKETSNVDGTDQTVTLTNSSLTPKVLWLWTTGQTSNAAYAENWMVSYGYSDGTNDACIAGASEDNETASDSGGIIRNDACCVILDAATTPTTINAQADVVSFNAGNFVLNWAVSDAIGSIIHYMVAGGTDITNVKVTSHAVPAGAGTGNESFTGVGFQGDFINILGSLNNQTVNIGGSSWNFSIGAATSSTARWAFGGDSEDGAPTSDTYNYKEITACHLMWNDITGTVLTVGDFVSFDADGFTINYSTNLTDVVQPFASLVIKGGLWNVGNGTAPATAIDQTINTTSGRDPEGVMFFTWGDTTTSSAGTGEPQNRVCIGGADNSLNQGCISTHDTDAAGTMINTSISLTNALIRVHTANATASSSTTVANANITDMDNDGNFIVNWSTTLSGMGYVWFVVSQVVAAGNDVVRSMPTETISISEPSVPALLRSKMRPLATQTIAISETKTRLGTKLRALTTQTITITEPAAPLRQKGKVKALPTETIIIGGGTLSRLANKIRTKIETVVISENLARLSTKMRALATQTVTIGVGTIAIQKGKLRALTTQTVTIAETSLARLATKLRPLTIQTVTVSETKTRLATKLRALVTQTTAIGIGTAATQKGKLRALATQTVTIAETSLNRLATKMRPLTTQIITLSESVARVKTTAGGANIARTLTQTVTIATGTAARLATKLRLRSETVSVAD